jgi:hypothetical protein
MNRRRLTELLVGHAVAEGSAVADALRVSRAPQARAAAAAVQAGNLKAGLLLAGLPPEQARLADLWPPALGPAQRRLRPIPSPLVSLAPTLATLGYLMVIGLLQAAVLSMLSIKVLPSMVEMTGFIGRAHVFDSMPLAEIGLQVLLGVLVLMFGVLAFAPHRVPGWGRHRIRAREAALGAALHEAGAPPEVWRAFASSLAALGSEHASQEELDGVMEQALGHAEASERWTTSILRGVGLGALGVVAFVTTVGIYQWLGLLAEMG